MADFYEGYYDAEVLATEWIASGKGSIGLRVDVDVRNAQGVTQGMTGFIWFTPKTMVPARRNDGSMGRSMAERQLNAIGYKGPLADARRIGTTINLAGNATRVQLKEEAARDGSAQLKIAFFSDRGRQASQEQLDKLFGGLAGAQPLPAKPQPPAEDDDVPF